MNAVAIDTNMMNSLFDNQKKVDELFDSIFDDDNFFIGTSSSSSQAESRRSTFDVESKVSFDDEKVKDSLLAIRTHNPVYLILPVVLEIAAIYYFVSNLM